MSCLVARLPYLGGQPGYTVIRVLLARRRYGVGDAARYLAGSVRLLKRWARHGHYFDARDVSAFSRRRHGDGRRGRSRG